MVLISHDPVLAARCDRTVKLVDGRLVNGPVAEHVAE
jgi:predicted ABC-type transport system involved in lysophospholipase L1 biosynthesis ATPase subunit